MELSNFLHIQKIRSKYKINIESDSVLLEFGLSLFRYEYEGIKNGLNSLQQKFVDLSIDNWIHTHI